MSAHSTPQARANFVSFEGIDGSGKSTQLRLLADELRVRGREVISTREPGGTPLGSRLRRLLLDTDAEVDPLAELLLYAADRAQHVRTLIRPALAAGSVVLTDRYADATIAYQGAGRGFPPELVAEVVQLATGGLMPDLTLIFDLDITHAHARRTRSRAPGDRLDNESAEFHQRVRDAYHLIARNEPARVRIVNAERSIKETHAEVMSIVLPSIGGD